MKSGRMKILLIPVAAILFMGFFKGDGDLYFQISKSIDIFGKVYKEISFNYVDEINPEEFMISGINGMLSSLDPYTVFIDEKKREDIDLLTNGKYGGIGISIGIRSNRITIVDLLDGYSAQRQGLRIGDVILKVNDIPVNKDNFDEMSSMVKGDPGTEVKLNILRDEQEMNFNILREEVKIRNLTYSGFYPESSNNVYLKLSSFTRTAGDEIRKALIDLKAEKPVESIVLDLRGNPGGLLDAAIDVCEKFLKKNQLIVSVMGRDTVAGKKYFGTEEPIAESTPLVVLVDNGSASASEIVAGAIQDHDRGVVLGTETFGKGLVQTVVPLSYNTSLKITTAKYYTPSGRCIQKIDYSHNNKVIPSVAGKSVSSFRTDNSRKVFAAGGITPDTVVENGSQLELIKELSARGMFFKFATEYHNVNNEKTFESEEDEVLFTKFKGFLENEKFDYSSAAEKQMSQLISTTEINKYDKSIINSLQEIRKKLKTHVSDELEKYRREVILSVRNEVLTRYEGQTGRMKGILKTDIQFKKAIEIINDRKAYQNLLTYHE